MLNHRFMHGKPSTDPSTAGVFVHQVDWMSDRGHPWLPQRGYYADRFAASLVNVDLPLFFSTSAAGFVLNAENLGGTAIRCAYARDGDSMHQPHGCATWGNQCYHGLAKFADMMRAHLQAVNHPDCCGCAAGVTPDDRSRCAYNEIVLDGVHWTQELPSIIVGVFYPINGIVHVREGSQSSASRLRSNFLRAYRGSISPEDAPLLAFDIAKARAREEPFIEGT